MKDWARAAPLINLTREQGHGRVTIDEAGRAVTHYPMTDEVDIRNIRAGVETLIRVHEAAGAEEIVGSARKSGDWRRGDDLDTFVADVTSQPIAPREFILFSAHQMGSCRMGSDPESSVANPSGELHDVPGVWIGDASAFPSPSGTNPMLTIMALARRTAHSIAAG
jgi:choline dehydrogenase-like flavoprotein